MVAISRHAILIPAVALVVAVLPLPYDYYSFLRCIVTAFAGFFAYAEYDRKSALTGWAIAFICLGLLFNPIIPIHLGRSSWFFLDLIAAAAFVAYWKRFPSKVSQ